MQQRIYKLLILFLVTLPVVTFGQKWKSYRMELTAGIGPSFMLSDVGGFQDEPDHFITDLNFKSTRASFTGNFNYHLRQDMSVLASFSYCFLHANDKYAGNEARRYRNFDINTHVYELGIMYRYYFVKEKFGHAFRLRGARSSFLSNISAYAGVGIAGFYFNPTGRGSDGKYHSLQPLGTEGQGIAGNPEKYSRFSFAIPAALGMKYALNTQINVGLELNYRFIFIDYLDDVSTNYYDNDAILSENGEMAAYLADPSSGEYPTWTHPGEKRGSPDNNDAFFTTMITFSYKILKGSSFRPRF
ncbi:outer membrane beta-barrel protein [bacterium SCSIO 12741]|nr:outer membrane beta-barrel protein [bacterium SCSIO 12741]